MNWFFAIIGYLPIALLLTVLYISANLAMLPFAYLAALAKKIQLMSRKSVSDFFMFLLLGWLILFVSIFKDTWEFFIHLFSFKCEKIKGDFDEKSLTLKEFAEFEKIIKFILKKQKENSESVIIPRN